MVMDQQYPFFGPEIFKKRQFLAKNGEKIVKSKKFGQKVGQKLYLSESIQIVLKRI